MIVVHKKIVTDEYHQPVEVVIPYAEWLEIERLLQLERPTRRVDLSKYAGALTMEITEDPVEYQRRIRAEWDRDWDREPPEQGAESDADPT